MKYFRRYLPTGQVWEVPFEGNARQLADAVNEFNRISNIVDNPLWAYWY